MEIPINKSKILNQDVFTVNDIKRHLQYAQTAAKEAGKHLMSRFGETHQLQNKDGTDSGIYSKLDQESNDIITNSLLKQWFEEGPNETVMIYSEESSKPIIAKYAGNNNYTFTEYEGELKSWNGMCWVADPICGSVAYARGIRDFIISIALVQNHKVLAAAVYDPPHDEMFTAIAGTGAYLNGAEIKPAITAKLNESIVSLEHRVYRDIEPDKIRQLACSVRKVRTAMTCALEMCYVACGRIDAVVKLDQAFYDYIGGALILNESLKGVRGLINFDNGQSILPFESLGCRVSFIASNGYITDELYQIYK